MKILDLSLFKIYQNLKFFFLKLFYFKNASKATLNHLYNWKEIHQNRISIINLILIYKKTTNIKYLEIGCDKNELFDSIPVINKIGVDPNRGGNKRMTSDEFFNSNSDYFDIIFIDGLHTYEQVRRDAINALNSLNEDGFVLFHDMLPMNWEQQHVPRIFSDWTGDCWKLIIELKNSIGIEFKIIAVDFGVLVIRKTNINYKIPNMIKEINKSGFDLFVDNYSSFPILSFEDFNYYLKSSVNLNNK